MARRNVVATFFLKMWLFIEGFLFMLFSKDNKGLGKNSNPDPGKLTSSTSTSKRVFFIRHGESDWNDVFNKGFGPSFFVRLVRAWLKELALLVTMDSIFLDSPLNSEGMEQAAELEKFLFESVIPEGGQAARDMKAVRGEIGTSVIVSSNLRRALATTTVALWTRIRQTGEKVRILSSLQEVSRNVDTKALAGEKEVPDLSRLSSHCSLNGVYDPDSIYDVKENYGNKDYSFFGIKRFRAFNEFVFQRDEDSVIVGGHSLWFRSFFQTYLPHGSLHPAKSRKIVNSGVIAFTMHCTLAEDGKPCYWIDEKSVLTLYGGFVAPKK